MRQIKLLVPMTINGVPVSAGTTLGELPDSGDPLPLLDQGQVESDHPAGCLFSMVRLGQAVVESKPAKPAPAKPAEVKPDPKPDPKLDPKPDPEPEPDQPETSDFDPIPVKYHDLLAAEFVDADDVRQHIIDDGDLTQIKGIGKASATEIAESLKTP